MIDKIKKLFALANNNPNEEEAARAMEKATALMMQHGIEMDQIEEGEKNRAVKGSYMTLRDKWEINAAAAAGALMGTRVVTVGSDRLAFWGRPENIAASEEIHKFICAQIEQFYKQALPSGMTQSERSKFRKSFKWAASIRVFSRAKSIINAPQKSSNSTALVVSHRHQLTAELDELSNQEGLRTKKASRRSMTSAAGALAGSLAGELVNLRNAVK